MIHTNPQHPELIVAFRWRAVYKYYFYIIRGDTESIQDIEEALEIHVHDNKYVKENPQSWNFEGNPFLNKLEKITEAANDPLVAGLLVIDATYKENLNHGR